MTATKILKYFMISVFLCVGMVVLYGKKLDVSVPPQKSDLIVCLGGGFVERFEKTIELYHKGYANKVVVTGSKIGLRYKNDKLGFWKIPYLEKHGIAKKNIYYLDHTDNTHEEMTQLKKYMKKKHYSHVLIVSDPTHLRRIWYMTEHLDYAAGGLFVRTVASDVAWWRESQFCSSPKEVIEAFKEVIGLMYYFIRY